MALNTLTMTIDMLLMAVIFHYIEFTEVAEADMRRYSYFLVYMISLPELVVCLFPIYLFFHKDYTFRSNLVCIDVQTSFDTIAWHKRGFPSRVSAVALVYKLLKVVKLESAVKIIIKILLVTGLVGCDSVPVGIVISRVGALILQLACYMETAASRYSHVYITPILLLKQSSPWLSRVLARDNQRLGCSQYSVIIEESNHGFMLPLENYTATVTIDLRSTTLCLIFTYSMFSCSQNQCLKSCQYIYEQRRSSPACTTTLTGEDRYCSCLTKYTATVTIDLRSTTLCLIFTYSMFSCSQNQCLKSCQYIYEQRRSSPACTTTLTGEDRYCSCLTKYTATVTIDLRSTTLCLIFTYSMFGCSQNQCLKSCQYIHEQRRSSPACTTTLTGEDRFCSCFYVPNNAQFGIHLSICEIHTVQRTGAGGEAPHVQYKEFLECVFFLCRRSYHGHYRADMVCWLKILKHGAKRPVRNPSLNCLDTGRNYLRYLSQTYEEYIHVLAWILTMNTTVVAIEVHSITTCILFNQSALYFIVYVTVCQIKLQINLGLCCTMYNQRISGSACTLVWTGPDLRCLYMYITLRILSLFLMSTINIATWNATGIMSSASYANNFLKKESIQVLGLSEHWLYRHNLHFLQAIHNSYNCFGVCDNALNTPSNRRVGKGGVAVLWHRSLDYQVSPLDIDSDRICGI